MRKLTFLVVDDDPIVLEVAKERLEELGYDCTTRDRALGTSTWVAQYRPDFVLLDVMMPALTGGELATVIRNRAPQSAVILYSSKPESELAELVERTGALGSISKSADQKRFGDELRQLVRRAGLSRVARVGASR